MMMKTLTSLPILLFLVLFLQSCSEEQISSDRFVAQVEAVEQPQPAGVVPRDHPVWAYLQTDEHSWRELDAFYRKQILKESDGSYAESLKKTAISLLVEAYPDFSEELAFYIDQQQQLGFVVPDVFLACLKTMEKYRDKGELTALAAETRERSIAYIRKQFADPQAVLERMGAGFEQLLAYSEL